MKHSVSTAPGGEDGKPVHSGIAVLKPYDPNEAIGIQSACKLAGGSRSRIIHLCVQHGLGRKIGARWAVSRVALHAFLNDDQDGLNAYLAGDRTGPVVARLYRTAGVPLPSQRG